MSVANEIRLLFLAGVALLGVLAVLVDLGIGSAVGAWRACRDRGAVRAAGQRGVLES